MKNFWLLVTANCAITGATLAPSVEARCYFYTPTISKPAIMPLTARFYLRRGDKKVQQGDFKGAVEDYSEALNLNPDIALATSGKSSFFLHCDLRAIETVCAQKLKDNNFDAYALSVLGAVELRRNEPGAHCHLSRASVLNKDLLFTQAELAVSEIGLPGYKLNRSQYIEAVQRLPNSALMHANLAEVCEHQQDHLQAVSEYKYALKLAPKWYGPISSLASLLERMQRYPETLGYIDQLIDITPGMGIHLAWKASIHSKMHQYDLAIADLNSAIKLNGVEKRSYYDLRSKAKWHLGDYFGALQDSALVQLNLPKNISPPALLLLAFLSIAFLAVAPLTMAALRRKVLFFD